MFLEAILNINGFLHESDNVSCHKAAAFFFVE